MKTPILTLIILILTGSCVTPYEINQIDEQKTYLVIDFTKYSEKGFFITPEKYNGNYESIGIVDIFVYPKAMRIENKIAKNVSAPKGTYIQNNWMIEKLDSDYIVETLYTEASEMGANGIMNFKITPTSKTIITEIDASGASKDITLSGVHISGFAIKK